MKFDIIESAREALHAAPVNPFNLRLHGGEIFKIINPDFLSAMFSGRIISDASKGLRILNPALIASIEDAAERRKKR